MSEPHALGPLDILLVEDNPGDARLIQEYLAEAASDLYLRHAESLAEGLDTLEGGGADVVLLDLGLPDSQGLDGCDQVRAAAPSVPVVVLTGLDDAAIGVQDYLVKGQVDGELLVRAMRYAVERKQAGEAREKLIAELDAFAHTVAHDIKSPLNLIVMLATMLGDDPDAVPGKRQEEHLQTIANVALKIGNIVDELLLLASVRSQADLKTGPVDMAPIVSSAKQRIAPLIEERQAEIVQPAVWPTALSYGPWIEEVWVNYLSNAVKYGGDPPRVELGAVTQPDGWVLFSVTDNGPGLTAEEQARLFAPFTRLDRVSAEGEGLGLSIVRRIMERLGGQAGVRSPGALGLGCTFYFVLPGIDPLEEPLASDTKVLDEA